MTPIFFEDAYELDLDSRARRAAGGPYDRMETACLTQRRVRRPPGPRRAPPAIYGVCPKAGRQRRQMWAALRRRRRTGGHGTLLSRRRQTAGFTAPPRQITTPLKRPPPRPDVVLLMKLPLKTTRRSPQNRTDQQRTRPSTHWPRLFQVMNM